MTWLQVMINTSPAEADIIEEILGSLGALSITYMDAAETPVIEPELNEMVLWARTQVIGLFDGKVHKKEILKNKLNRYFAKEDFENEFIIEIKQLKNKNWERIWLENFKPMRFGQDLWVCPTGMNVKEDGLILAIDPGLAFGTGTHPTTALCLNWLARANLKGKYFVDFGCGSGILSIAALKLGAKKVLGIDHDEQAIKASKENAKKNNIVKNFQVVKNDNIPEYSADFLIANIVTNTLIKEKDILLKLTKKNGEILLCGVLQNQIERLKEAFHRELIFLSYQEKNQWVLIHARKK
tara:strand:+ start:9036 stop:9923 length:888 start_codon:yes stop_codon:yes gene_type:complete